MKTNSKKSDLSADKTFTIKLTIKKDEIQKEYQKSLAEVQKSFEAKGFRKGKAPLEFIESQVSLDKIIEDVASHAISKAYSEKVNELKLKPIIQPSIDFKNPPATLDKDWELELTSCELPELTLNDKYLTDAKKINTQKFDDENKRIDQFIEMLIENSKVKLPQILIDSDTQHHLSHLVEQADQAGLTVNQYLEDKKTTLEAYKNDLSSRITKEWTINLAISKVAETQKIEVKPEEINNLVSQNQELASNLNFVYYLLIQQKVFDFLKKQ